MRAVKVWKKQRVESSEEKFKRRWRRGVFEASIQQCSTQLTSESRVKIYGGRGIELTNTQQHLEMFL
jgi:hypothetical protein